MTKVTEDLKIEIPADLAKAYKIQPGDEMEWVPAGEGLKLTKTAGEPADAERAEGVKELIEWAKEISSPDKGPTGPGRGWTREDLYDRGDPR